MQGVAIFAPKVYGGKMFRKITFVAGILVLLGMATACSSSNKGGEVVAGGLSKISNSDDQVKVAYDLLKKEMGAKHPALVLGKVEEAFTQVVAGYNTYLVCAYTEKGKSTTMKLRGKIYTDLNKVSTVSEIELNYKP